MAGKKWLQAISNAPTSVDRAIALVVRLSRMAVVVGGVALIVWAAALRTLEFWPTVLLVVGAAVLLLGLYGLFGVAPRLRTVSDRFRSLSGGLQARGILPSEQHPGTERRSEPPRR